MTDKINMTLVTDMTDVVISKDHLEDFMSRPLMNQTEESKLRGLLTLLKVAERQPSNDTAEIPKSSIREVVGLVELLLTQKPIVLDKDLSSNEAAEVAGVSRNMILKMLRTGRLKGYEVGTHWRVSKDSLLKYLEDREDMTRMMADLDKAGYGME